MNGAQFAKSPQFDVDVCSAINQSLEQRRASGCRQIVQAPFARMTSGDDERHCQGADHRFDLIEKWRKGVEPELKQIRCWAELLGAD